MGSRTNSTSLGSTLQTSTKGRNTERTINGRKEETPIKNPLPLKRRSLMHDMNWEDKNTVEKEMKHPMEMRSRKSCRLKKDYYDCEEYSDYGDDLSFLFDDDLPDLEYHPRRKRKKRLLLTAKASEEVLNAKHSHHLSTSNEKNAKDTPTSAEDDFCKTRPNLTKTSLFNAEISCNFPKVTSGTNAETLQIFESRGEQDGENHILGVSLSNEQTQKRKILGSVDIVSITKSPRLLDDPVRSEKDCKISCSEEKSNAKSNKTMKICSDNTVPVKNHMIFNCDTEKCDKNDEFAKIYEKSTLSAKKTDSTVLKMALRRQHSTPSPGGARFGYEEIEKIPRTISSYSGAARTEGPTSRELKSQNNEGMDDCEDETYCCDEISDSEQFVDSPDSGFSSETSCSAVTPDGESLGSLTFTPVKCNQPQRNSGSKDYVSRTASNDSGVMLHCTVDESEVPAATKPKNGELRLDLCQKSVFEAQHLEQEEKEKQEEQLLRERYQCRWIACPNPFESRCGADLHSHLKRYHLENYCCRWEGCKFFDMESRKSSFLQRHIGEHSGEKPFKCILDGCDASFSSTSSWKRHVEAHYSGVALPKARIGGDSDGFSRYLLNSRRVKDKRKTLANRHDCMDERTLTYIRGALIRDEVAMTTIDDACVGPKEILFRAEVIGERVAMDGKESKLVKWNPENILLDEWIPTSEFKSERKVKKSELSFSAKAEMKRLFFFERRNGKSARKMSVLDSIF